MNPTVAQLHQLQAAMQILGLLGTIAAVLVSVGITLGVLALLRIVNW